MRLLIFLLFINELEECFAVLESKVGEFDAVPSVSDSTKKDHVLWVLCDSY